VPYKGWKGAIRTPMPAAFRLHAIFQDSAKGRAIVRQPRLNRRFIASLYDIFCAVADNHGQTGPASNLI
jgi:hypothetical protein